MSKVIFQVGDPVTYVPNHAKNASDPICERGHVSSVENNEDGTQKVWVIYSGSTGQLTPTKNLIKG